MIRTILPTTTLILLLAAAIAQTASAQAYGNGYAGVEGGVLIPSDSSTALGPLPVEIESGVGGTAGLRAGGHLSDHFRMDALAAWHGADTERAVAFGSAIPFTGSVNLLTITGNVFFDLLSRDAVVNPYIGGGLGLAVAWFDPTGPTASLVASSDDTGLAYLVGAGVHFRASDSVRIKLGYRYLGTAAMFDAASIVFTEDVDVAGHEIVVGFFKEF